MKKKDITEKKYVIDFSSSTLHIIAMILMLLDHMWATITPGNRWMNDMGRIAFPIFAFMIVEGYFYTHNIKKYLLRLLIFALISEIPFDYMYGAMPFYPYHQNVIWTLLIAMIGVWCVDTVKNKKNIWFALLISVVLVPALTLVTLICNTDFYDAGIMTVFLFYYFRGTKWWCHLGKIIGMYYINCEILGGLCYIITIFGHEFEIVQQGFALFALIPIYFYHGKKGIESKAFQYFCYAFYPMHIIILQIIYNFTV